MLHSGQSLGSFLIYSSTSSSLIVAISALKFLLMADRIFTIISLFVLLSTSPAGGSAPFFYLLTRSAFCPMKSSGWILPFVFYIHVIHSKLARNQAMYCFFVSVVHT